jgi:hypothetical protein
VKGFAVQPTLRVSALYLGSALFIATGAVTIADQPLRTNPKNPFCGGCAQGNGGTSAPPCVGVTCLPTGGACSQIGCTAGNPGGTNNPKCPC